MSILCNTIYIGPTVQCDPYVFLCSSVHRGYSTPHHLLPTKTAMPPNFSQVRLGQIRLVKVRLGQIRLGQVIFGQYWLVFSLILNQITISVRFIIFCYPRFHRRLVSMLLMMISQPITRPDADPSANHRPTIGLLQCYKLLLTPSSHSLDGRLHSDHKYSHKRTYITAHT